MKRILVTCCAISLSLAASAQSDQAGSKQQEKWTDEYSERNKPLFDAIVTMHKKRWNQAAGYLVRGEGDTVRPYTESEWMRDSLELYNRNWDSGDDRWPASFSVDNVYDPEKNYKLDSAQRNQAGRSQDIKFEDVPGKTHSLEKDNLEQHTGEDFIFMQDGHLMMSKSDIQTRILGYYTLPDGSKVLEDGTVLLSNKQEIQLKEGERINIYERQFHIY